LKQSPRVPALESGLAKVETKAVHLLLGAMATVTSRQQRRDVARKNHRLGERRRREQYCEQKSLSHSHLFLEEDLQAKLNLASGRRTVG
jgi:hypothetical protein